MAIVVTGAAGFIGSALVSFLNEKGQTDLILVDDFTKSAKLQRTEGYQFTQRIDRSELLQIVNFSQIDFVFHIGARTDTAEMDASIFDELNLHYSKQLWQRCSQSNTPLIYASSAATYGDGSLGFDDRDSIIELRPLNLYGQSKQDFDVWAEDQDEFPPFWCGLKFFNVFGPNESHKERMASVVYHAYQQISTNGKLRLFRSHDPNFADGEQKRDFIYIKDLLQLLWFWYNNRSDSGLYNAGTGKAHSFNELARSIFNAMDLSPDIEYIPTPADIRDKYQYFTQASMDKTRSCGFDKEFQKLEKSVEDYIQSYLIPGERY